jgi:hypothetical protein
LQALYATGEFMITTPNSESIQTSTPSPSYVNIVKPFTYDFRVAEYVDENNVVQKVGLQVRIYEAKTLPGGYGSSTDMIQDWTDVPRIQLAHTPPL